MFFSTDRSAIWSYDSVAKWLLAFIVTAQLVFGWIEQRTIFAIKPQGTWLICGMHTKSKMQNLFLYPSSLFFGWKFLSLFHHTSFCFFFWCFIKRMQTLWQTILSLLCIRYIAREAKNKRRKKRHSVIPNCVLVKVCQRSSSNFCEKSNGSSSMAAAAATMLFYSFSLAAPCL